MKQRVLKMTSMGLFLLVAAAACGPRARFEGWTVRKQATSYRVGMLSGDWKHIKGVNGDAAFINSSTSAVILANASCEDFRDAPLEYLTKHLLIGYTEREILSREKVMMDNREALITILTAKLDGVKVKMALCVVKKNYCIYDLSYAAPPGMFDAALEDFDRYVKGFEVLSGKGK